MKTETALATLGTILGEEHLFTFSLPSLPTTREFFSTSPEGAEQIREAYGIATGLSLGLGFFISRQFKTWAPLGATGLMAAIFIALYERALRR